MDRQILSLFFWLAAWAAPLQEFRSVVWLPLPKFKDQHGLSSVKCETNYRLVILGHPRIPEVSWAIAQYICGICLLGRRINIHANSSSILLLLVILDVSSVWKSVKDRVSLKICLFSRDLEIPLIIIFNCTSFLHPEGRPRNAQALRMRARYLIAVCAFVKDCATYLISWYV